MNPESTIYYCFQPYTDASNTIHITTASLFVCDGGSTGPTQVEMCDLDDKQAAFFEQSTKALKQFKMPADLTDLQNPMSESFKRARDLIEGLGALDMETKHLEFEGISAVYRNPADIKTLAKQLHGQRTKHLIIVGPGTKGTSAHFGANGSRPPTECSIL